MVGERVIALAGSGMGTGVAFSVCAFCLLLEMFEIVERKQ